MGDGQGGWLIDAVVLVLLRNLCYREIPMSREIAISNDKSGKTTIGRHTHSSDKILQYEKAWATLLESWTVHRTLL